jgi:hypothetical protein
VLSDEADVAAVKLLLRAIYGADPEAQVQDVPLATLLQVIPLRCTANSSTCVCKSALQFHNQGLADAADSSHAHAALRCALPQVLRLADRIQVPRVVAAAGGRFTTAEPLDWDVAQSIWALPAGCEENAAYMTAFAAAAATLQQELGDLEVAMLDAARRERLLGLPFKALRCLLESSATRVFSENTVFLVCDMWLRRRGGGEAEQQLQLARLVRLPHVTSPYLLTVVGQSAWLASRMPWQVAAAWAHAPGPLRISMLRHNPILARAKAWRLPPRPYSNVKELVIEWGLSLVELRRIHEAVQAGVRGANRTVSEPQYWGGFEWRLHLCALILGGGVSFEMVLVPQGVVVEGAVATADVTMGRGGLVPHESGVGQCTFADVSGRKGYIYKGVFKGCMQKAWSEGPWRAAGLVGEDGHVRVRATITNVQ